jgi:hypothetical protein
MTTRRRQLVIFGAPVLVGALNLMHPVIAPPIYPKLEMQVHSWIHLHVLNLFLFALLGLAAYLLVRDLPGSAATISRVAIAIFVPLYAAFDTLAGIGTGILVKHARGLSGDELAQAKRLIDAWWGSKIIFSIAVAGSVAWVIAMLAATVAFSTPDRRRLTAVLAVVFFLVNEWARSNLFQGPDGVSIRPAWWFVTLATSAVMILVSKPRITAGALTLSASLFGATHVTPTGPLGAACFLVAALYIELTIRKQPGATNAMA